MCLLMIAFHMKKKLILTAQINENYTNISRRVSHRINTAPMIYLITLLLFVSSVKPSLKKSTDRCNLIHASNSAFPICAKKK